MQMFPASAGPQPMFALPCHHASTLMIDVRIDRSRSFSWIGRSFNIDDVSGRITWLHNRWRNAGVDAHRQHLRLRKNA